MQDQSGQQNQRFEFTGKGWEYFRIWIVNLLLTIVTLGIYSAWAKVRRMQYFYRNTRLADASFDYHGTPKAILKGRIIAFALLIAYNASFKFNPILGMVVALLLGLVMPWLLMRSLRFKLYNSSYRGLRFGFAGDRRGAYDAFLKYPMLAGLTLYLAAPLAHQRIKKYQFDNSRFGSTPFKFAATVKGFYLLYLSALAVMAGTLLLVIALAMMSGTGAGAKALVTGLIAAGPIMMLIMVASILIVSSLFSAYMQNLVWDNTTLGAAPHLLLRIGAPLDVDTGDQFPRRRADAGVVHAVRDHTHAALQTGIDGGGVQRRPVRFRLRTAAASQCHRRRDRRNVRCRHLLLTFWYPPPITTGRPPRARR